MADYGFTLRREKTQLGKPEVVWFGNTFYKFGMSPDPLKVKTIKDRPAPKDKVEVKSFLQTVEFSSTFMRSFLGLIIQ